MSYGPRINDKFPIHKNLSPPIIESPISECSESVYVTGFVPHAKIHIFAALTELLAEENPAFSFAEIRLNRSMEPGESITATQTIDSITSVHSLQPVIVSTLEESAVKNTKPVIKKNLFECGIVVPIENLVPGVHVHVTEDGQEIGNKAAAHSSQSVITEPLHANGRVSAIQVSCEKAHHSIKGLPADNVIVKPAPNPVPTPQPEASSMIPGNDTVTLANLIVGAGVKIFDQGQLISSGWYATSESNYFSIHPTISESSSISATQELCGNESDSSDPVTPNGELRAPVVLDPLCAGANFVIIRATTINATVVVMRNSSIVGYGGAGSGDVILALGGDTLLNTGDIITAIQYIDQTISPSSYPITVVSHLRQPAVEILGGEPFFKAKGDEQSIDGPVFPRGRGAGPHVQIQACCRKKIHIRVLSPNGQPVAEPQLSQLFPGYYKALWTWTSLFNGTTEQIPVGKYTVVVETDCSQKEVRVPFYVIFDPVTVGGTARFSFDDTAIWFGTGKNSLRGLHYYLHLSDQRVFSIAMNAINGETDSYNAAIILARFEEQLFEYSLNYHTNDVVDLIENYTEAQCADDTCCLIALMRAVGIPAHPVTADAALETGDANWTFDTWVEFLAAYDGSTEWRVLHPHEYRDMLPESRATFGTRPVATKGFNDLIIMANKNWITADIDDGTSDVSYSRNSCDEPNKNLNKTSWIDELCEQGYWAKSHWDCTASTPYSLRPRNGFRILNNDLRFGGNLTGIVDVINTSERRHFGSFIVELVTHLPESKQFSETSFSKVSIPTTLDFKESIALPFDLTLPKTLSPGRELFLWAHVDGHTVILHEVRIPPRLQCKVSATEKYTLDEYATIDVTISNISDELIQNVVLKLKAPYALQVEDSNQYFEEIKPHNTKEVSWKVLADAPLSSGSFHISISSTNGGGLIMRHPFRIIEFSKKVHALPGLLPKKE